MSSKIPPNRRKIILEDIIMITLSDIQKRLSDAIKQSGYTQTALAKKLSIGQQTISHYVKGDKLPALDTLANLCKILDISPAYILCFED